MEDKLDQSNVFIQFCTEESKNHDGLRFERQMTVNLMNVRRINAFTVFQDQLSIPTALRSQLEVKYNTENFDGFIEKLYTVIIR